MYSVEYLRSVLEYDADTGIFTWLVKPAQCVHVGDIAGTLDSRGYRQIRLNGKKELAHRIAWAMAYGEWPTHCIDHVNHDKADNRLSNLRAATASQNRYNMPKYKNNTSGIKGVSFNRKAGKWRAFISADGVKKYLGEYHTKEAAASARASAAQLLHGDYANV